MGPRFESERGHHQFQISNRISSVPEQLLADILDVFDNARDFAYPGHFGLDTRSGR